MNTLHLRYAVEVSRTGSISQAAENLYMSQPNLSRALKELEASIGFALFDRTSRGAVPTQKGREFLGYAINILTQLDEMEALYDPSRTGIQTFGVCVTRASYISHAFARFLAGLPSGGELDVDFREANSVRTIQYVADSAYSIGIVRYNVDKAAYFASYLEEKALCHETVWEHDMVVVMNGKNPLASEEITPDALAGQLELIYGDRSLPYSNICEARHGSVNNRGKRLFLYERASLLDFLNTLPDAYMWVSPVPADLLSRYGLVMRRCPGAARVRDVLIYPRGHQLTTLEKGFLDEIEAVRGELKKARF